jgi:dTDP-4-dehydrorhamnose reductase
MKILIIGSKGMLGVDLVNHLSKRYDVTGVDIAECNICDYSKLEEVIKTIKPSIIINTAAYTDVDACENDGKRELAYNVNAEAVRNLAIISTKNKCKLIHISTDYVFDGNRNKSGGYYEYDYTNPINEYGKSKLKGENYFKEIDDKYTIIRTSWLFGKARANYINWIIKNCLEHKEFQVVNNLYSTPTFTHDLARFIGKVIENDLYWIMHISNSGTTTKFEIANYIAQKLKKGNIKPIDYEQLNWTARRPYNSSLKNFVLQLTTNDEMPSWQDAIDRYLTKFI